MARVTGVAPDEQAIASVMILDWVESTKAYVLRVPRNAQASGLIQDLMKDHGFDLSIPASNSREAVLYTREPYAAVTFYEHATPAARDKLLSLQASITSSRVDVG